MQEINIDILNSVFSQYNIDGKIVDYVICNQGHINKTYFVSVDNGETINKYTFQNVNTYAFKEPIKIMKNIQAISTYLDEKNKDGVPEGACKLLKYLENKKGLNYSYDANGEFWRIYDYVGGVVTYDRVENPEILKSAGAAFGTFQRELCGFPLDLIEDTIPDFHNTKKRLSDFFEIAEKDPYGRAKELKEEIKFFDNFKESADDLISMAEKGTIPFRVTHNDTKFNNVLIDKDTLKPVYLIDLDTIMKGLSIYDFGDAIRFAANTAAEDETDLSKVGINLNFFEAFSEGFIGSTKGMLTNVEISNMTMGAILITVELASRFLGDYINGDLYFRTTHPKHNLERALNQMKLVRDMQSNYDKMCNIIDKFR